MKRLIALAIVALSIYSCDMKKDKIEVIQDYDSIYLSEADVDLPAKEKDSTFSDRFQEDINNLLRMNYKKTLNKPLVFRIAFRVYINENGNIDKIKVLDAKSFNLKIDEPGAVEFKDYDKIYNKLPDLLANYSSNPASKMGRNVKCRRDIILGAAVFPDGHIQIFIPFDLSMDYTYMSDKEYLVEVSEQPEPVGGMAAIQKQIRYPEIAKRAGIQGRVLVKAFLDENGNVVKTALLKGLGAGCDEQVINAVANIKFKPGVLNGKKVKTQVVIPIMFKLK